MKKSERTEFFENMAHRMKSAAIVAADSGNSKGAVTFYKLASICADKASGVERKKYCACYEQIARDMERRFACDCSWIKKDV